MKVNANRSVRGPRIWLTGLALLLSLCFSARADEDVELRFEWPNGLDARVAFDAVRERTGPGRSFQRRLSGNYRLTSARVQAGLLIRIQDMQLDLDSLPTAVRGSPVQRMLLQATSAFPDYLVNDQGQIVRVDGVAALQRRLRAGIEELMGNVASELKPRIDRVLAQSTSKEQLESRVREYWNRDVGMWVGARLAPGKVYESRSVTRIPLLDDAQVPLKVQIRLNGRVPCVPQGAPRACVELQMDSSPEPAGVQEALRAFLETMAGRVPGSFKLENIQVDTRVKIVTQPDTLLPQRVESVRKTQISASQDGVAQGSSQTDRRSTQYHYN